MTFSTTGQAMGGHTTPKPLMQRGGGLAPVNAQGESQASPIADSKEKAMFEFHCRACGKRIETTIRAEFEEETCGLCICEDLEVVWLKALGIWG